MNQKHTAPTACRMSVHAVVVVGLGWGEETSRRVGWWDSKLRKLDQIQRNLNRWIDVIITKQANMAQCQGHCHERGGREREEHNHDQKISILIEAWGNEEAEEEEDEEIHIWGSSVGPDSDRITKENMAHCQGRCHVGGRKECIRVQKIPRSKWVLRKWGDVIIASKARCRGPYCCCCHGRREEHVPQESWMRIQLGKPVPNGTWTKFEKLRLISGSLFSVIANKR